MKEINTEDDFQVLAEFHNNRFRGDGQRLSLRSMGGSKITAINEAYSGYVKLYNSDTIPGWVVSNHNKQKFFKEKVDDYRYLCFDSTYKYSLYNSTLEYMCERFFHPCVNFKSRGNTKYYVGAGVIAQKDFGSGKMDVLVALTTSHNHHEYVLKSNYVNPSVLTLYINEKFDSSNNEFSKTLRSNFRKLIKTPLINKGVDIIYSDDLNDFIYENTSDEFNPRKGHDYIKNFSDVNKVREISRDFVKYSLEQRIKSTLGIDADAFAIQQEN